MNKQNNRRLAVIVPCMNEQDMLYTTNNELLIVLDSLIDNNLINSNSYICYVDDGSTDETWGIIKQLCSEIENVRGIKLSKNFGHQNALLSGLSRVKNKCDFVITIDADLQQDINVIPEMIEKHYSGSEIIFGIRNNRIGDSLLKKVTGILFNKIMNGLGSSLLKNHADFRLMGEKALKALLEHSENNIFIRGLVSDIGFQTSIVKFDQQERKFGKTKYTFYKMIRFAYDGIFSLSIIPLRFLFFVGILSTSISIVYVFYILYIKYIIDQAVPGWASIVLPIWVFSSIQLVTLGIIGEYLSKIFMDVKKRPRFIIENEIK